MTLEPANPVHDPNRYNPAPHWRIYSHPQHGPVPVQVQDFDYPDYQDGRFLGYAAYPDEETARAAIRELPAPPPKVVEFNGYLHDTANSWELAEEIERQTGVKIGDELREKIGRPFYEVTLRCSLDTTTGAVTLISAKL